MGISGPKSESLRGTGKQGEASQSLILRGPLQETQLEALCAELEGLTSPLDQVDLRDLTALEPPTLAVLAVALQRLEVEGLCDLSQALPCRDAASCLDSDGLTALARSGGSRWHVRGPRVLGWKTFDSEEGTLSAAYEVALKLLQHARWSTDSAQAMAGLTFELGENVRQHSQKPRGVVAVAIDKRSGHVKLAVADSGIGIRASLRRNPKFDEIDDDLTAIEQAMGPGASGEPGTGGGMGLFLTRAMVRGNGGRMLVRSGDAKCEESDQRVAKRRLARLQGTLIGIEAKTDQPLRDDEIRARMQSLGGAAGMSQ